MMVSNRRFDSFKIEKYEKTQQGYLRIDGIVTRTGIFKYPDGNDLRSSEEVLKKESLKTMEMLPVTWEHPITPDNKIDFLNAENTAKYQKGFVSSIPEVIQDGPIYLIKLKDIIITDPTLIYEMERPTSEYTQFSLGYDCKNVRQDGIFEGESYNKNQTNIIYNHLAVVKNARCGSVCSVIQEGDIMTKKNDSACTCGAKKTDAEDPKDESKSEAAVTKSDIKEMMDSEERFSSLEKGHEKIIGMLEELHKKMSESKKADEEPKDEPKEEPKDESKTDSILKTITSFNSKKIDSSYNIYDRDSFIRSATVKNHI